MKKIYYKNHLIKKNLSQIFLTDTNIIDAIIKTINIQKNQKIIEIGPGLGALTQHIVNMTNFFIAIEQDSSLVNRLTQTIKKNNFQIINQDVMTTNFFHLARKAKQKLRLIGNLPYHISTKFIMYLFKYTNVIYDMQFMLQKEVAERFLANPNNKEYGRLSIITQYYYKITPLLKIPMHSFTPIPKVESMMIKLLPHIISPYPKISNISQLSLLTKLAFSQRRKLIKNSLSTLFNTTEMIQQGIDITSRAENLTVHQYCNLANRLNEKLFHTSNTEY